MSQFPDFLNHVRAEIERLGAAAAYISLLAENNAQIRPAGVTQLDELGDGRKIAAERTAIHTGLMGYWAEKQQVAFGYDRPFAVVALGGTGRAEMTPFSDTDFAFLFDDVIEDNPFLLELQNQTIQSDGFRKYCGFSSHVLPFNLDDMPDQEEKQLNSFLDMQPVYDPDGLADRFRKRIRESYDPFEHFLYVSRFWREHWGESDARPERIDKFDIKNEGLRVFLAGVWSLAGSEFRHCQEIYDEIEEEDDRVLKAYGFLLRIRAFIHSRYSVPAKLSMSNGNHAEDIMGFEHFTAFGEMLCKGASDKERFEFSNEVRGCLLTARRRVERFTWGVIGRILKEGRPIHRGIAIVYGTGGLRDTAPDREDKRSKSRAALAMLLAAQRHSLPIDPSEMDRTFRNAGDWLQPVPELSALFYESRGSLAKSLEVLAGLPGACERLFPGYEKFESSMDERVMTERKLLRGALARQKLKALEQKVSEGRSRLDEARNPEALADMNYGVSVSVQAALLGTDHLAAVKLALQTKRLPVTADDLRISKDESLSLSEQFSSGCSGIALEVYYEQSFSRCGFSVETLELARFLVKNRRMFKDRAAQDLMDARQVKRLIDECGGDEMRLRCLFVFTCADRTSWESETKEPARWFNIRELYEKAIRSFRPHIDPKLELSAAGFDLDDLKILEDFGHSFFGGGYRLYVLRYGSYLLRLAESVKNAGSSSDLPPKVEKIRIGSSQVLAIATLDHPGIAASISGALWRRGIALSQAHLFSARKYGLALDFFHLAPVADDARESDSEIAAAVRDAIASRQYLEVEDEAALPDDLAFDVTLESTVTGYFHLRGKTEKDMSGLIYYLACRAFRLLHADIYGLAAHSGSTHSWVSLYLGLPESMSLEEGRRVFGLL